MSQDIVLMSKDTPTFFNKIGAMGAAIGALTLGGLALGDFMPGVLTAVGLGASTPVVAAAAAAGVGALAVGAVGAFVGKVVMQREATSGKSVGESSFFNKDTLLGALVAGTVALVASVGLSAYLPDVANFLGTSGAGLSATPGLGTVGLAIGAGAAIVGGIVGGVSGSVRMENEYDQAQRQHVVRHISNNISPDVGQAVEYAMNPNKEWVQNVLQEKLSSVSRGEPGRTV